MRNLVRAALPVKLAMLLALAGAIAVIAAPPADLPEAADAGQARAEAGAANADAADGQPADEGSDADADAAHTEDVIATLTENQERLLATLQLVLDERADEHAAEALEAVIARLSTENIGLTRAAEAVSSGGGAPADLPGAAEGHPSGHDHPSAEDHPGRP